MREILAREGERENEKEYVCEREMLARERKRERERP